MTAERRTLTVESPTVAEEIAAITPKDLFAELHRGVLGQDRALRFVAVAIYKHTTGKVSGNILLIGNSGTGKTTVMNNIQRVYDTIPAYRAFRAVTILNANLLVESERTEFRPDRMFTAVEQRARTLLGERPTAAELKEAMERGTVCVDEIDKMSTVVAGKPNPIGVVLQQGLLTLMEGEKVPYRTHVWEGERVREATGKPVGVKTAIGGWEFLHLLGEAVQRRGLHSAPDFLAIDGGEGGSGALVVI